jgi:2-polyprenyl-3-methyl-5-hydroxy-6-metoxy-1,4-benzoquinol methylase
MQHHPPEDWADKSAWDRYLSAEARESEAFRARSHNPLQFVKFAIERGGRVWFSGCGVDPAPRAYAALGCTVLATDLSAVAVDWQRARAREPPTALFEDWASWVSEHELAEAAGTLTAMEHDFTATAPEGPFDVMINRRAFHGLSPAAKAAGARHFFRALRPAGAAIFDTLNIQGKERTLLEDSLIEAGFYVPFHKSERWYRDKLDGTGIVYAMILGRPIVPHWDQYPAKKFAEFEKRDREILMSFRSEYERRRLEEAPEVQATLEDPGTIAAHMVYSTG